MLKVVQCAVLVVDGILSFATLHMTIAHMVKDIGILASMGASPSGIGAVFVFSGFVVGAIGCVCGLITGFLTAYNFMLQASIK